LIKIAILTKKISIFEQNFEFIPKFWFRENYNLWRTIC